MKYLSTRDAKSFCLLYGNAARCKFSLELYPSYLIFKLFWWIPPNLLFNFIFVVLIIIPTKIHFVKKQNLNFCISKLQI